MSARLEGKVALVTGGSSGIGAATIDLFIEHGAEVVIADLREPKKELENRHFFHDVSLEESWKRLINLVHKKHKRLDILVNAASVLGTEDLQNPEAVSLMGWQNIFRTNVEGTMLGCRFGIQAMKEHGGSIVNISSVIGKLALPMLAAYGASKATISHFTKNVAIDCAQNCYSIRCNCVSPGAIRTPLWDPLLGTGQMRRTWEEKILSKVPLGRWGKPEEVAYAVLYLASDESSFVTGAEIAVDGGHLASS